MTPKNIRVFLDTSVLFAAVLSPTGGARKLFHLAEAGVLRLMVGPTVLSEAEEVVSRKAPATLPVLAQLLDLGRVETSPAPTEIQVESARQYVQYAPDARVLAEAIRAEPDWFVSHDKEHFLNEKREMKFAFAIGTPGDLIQSIKDGLYPP
jgi:predicted nucleic acid-binding protein